LINPVVFAGMERAMVSDETAIRPAPFRICF
jgi:hypothetical protein